MSRKRKAPTQRKTGATVPAKKALLVTSQPTDVVDDLTAANLLLELGNVNIHHDYVEEATTSCTVTTEGPVTPVTSSSDKETQATSSIELSLKIENNLLKNQLKMLRTNPAHHSTTTQVLDITDVKDDDVKCRFYTGLVWLQVMALWEFLGPAKYKLTMWGSSMKNPESSPSKRPGPSRKLSPMNQMFVLLIRLRLGLLHQDIAYRFQVSSSYISRCVLTWIQFLYHEFNDSLRPLMFPTRDVMKAELPKCFKKYKNLRVIIDATEFFVQSPTHFEEQGNMYSSYKAKCTFKVLIGIAPKGSCVFVSNAYEGSISDNQLTIQSGFLDQINPGDLVMADRGFTIREMLQARGANLNIPPFLGKRSKFTAQEEAETKKIAKGRIHVERFIERLKKFRLFQKTIPLSLKPVFSQMVFVGCCLVNFQVPIVPS